MDALMYENLGTVKPGSTLFRYYYATVLYFIAMVLIAAGMFKIYDPATMLGTLASMTKTNNTSHVTR